MKLASLIVLMPAISMALVACGEEKKSNSTVQEFKSSDALVFPTTNLITVDEVPFGNYALSHVYIYETATSEKALFDLPIQHAGAPKSETDHLVVKAAWDPTRPEGEEQIWTLTTPIDLRLGSDLLGLDFSELRDFNFQASSRQEGQFSLAAPEGSPNSIYSILFSHAAAVNSKVYNVLGTDGAIQLDGTSIKFFTRHSTNSGSSITLVIYSKV